MPKLRDIDCWIETSGVRLPEYGPKFKAENKVECYIEAHEDEAFTLLWQPPPTLGRYAFELFCNDVSIHPIAFSKDRVDVLKCMGLKMDETTYSPFVFKMNEISGIDVHFGR